MRAQQTDHSSLDFVVRVLVTQTEASSYSNIRANIVEWRLWLRFVADASVTAETLAACCQHTL